MSLFGVSLVAAHAYCFFSVNNPREASWAEFPQRGSPLLIAHGTAQGKVNSYGPKIANTVTLFPHIAHSRVDTTEWIEPLRAVCGPPAQASTLLKVHRKSICQAIKGLAIEIFVSLFWPSTRHRPDHYVVENCNLLLPSRRCRENPTGACSRTGGLMYRQNPCTVQGTLRQ